MKLLLSLSFPSQSKISREVVHFKCVCDDSHKVDNHRILGNFGDKKFCKFCEFLKFAKNYFVKLSSLREISGESSVTSNTACNFSVVS